MAAVQTFLLEAADAVVRSFDLGEPWKLEGGRLPKVRHPLSKYRSIAALPLVD